MYTFVLLVHSWLRWAALVAGIAATVTSFSDPSATSGRSRSEMWGLALMMLLDIQMLLGLLLYLVLSPITALALRDFGAAMKNPPLRFFAVEHLALMLLAVVVAHGGRVLGRNAKTPEAKRMRMGISFAIATALMILAIPWPGMSSGRPLFRL